LEVNGLDLDNNQYGIKVTVSGIDAGADVYGVYANSKIGVYGTGLVGIKGVSASGAGYGVYAQNTGGGAALYASGDAINTGSHTLLRFEYWQQSFEIDRWSH
jgi:hypothetical protein